MYWRTICHALCEVIERDAVSIADLCASTIPYNILKKMVDSLKNRAGYSPVRYPNENIFVDDSNIFPDIDLSEFPEEFESVRRLVKKFADAHVSLLIKDITQDNGIPTFVAGSVEWITNDYGYFAKGFGTHPDTRIALIRAITEVSQTRAVNIHGARDDLKKIRYKENDEIYKRRWQFMPASFSLRRKKKVGDGSIKFSEIRRYNNKDILDDIKFILSRLKKDGIKRVIIVDLTNPDIGIPVVRAIVPGLETFEVTRSIMGRRAKEYFRSLYCS